jgi:hypothetical protein
MEFQLLGLCSVTIFFFWREGVSDAGVLTRRFIVENSRLTAPPEIGLINLRKEPGSIIAPLI